MFTEEEIRNYLLDDLTAEKREAFEEAFFTDDELFERLEVAEMRLIDSFASGAMNASQEKIFNRKFAVTPERRAEVKKAILFHKNLKAYRTESNAGQKENSAAVVSVTPNPGLFERLKNFFGGNLFPIISTATALFLLTASFVWFFSRTANENLTVEVPDTNVRKPFNLPADNLPNTAAQNGKSNSVNQNGKRSANKTDGSKLNNSSNLPEENREIQMPEQIVSAKLLPATGNSEVSTASPEQNLPTEIRLPKTAKKIALRLQLNAAEEDETFIVTILDKSGAKIQTLTNLKPRAAEGKQIIAIDVSAEKLKNGRYAINASGNRGHETIYQFKTVTKNN